MKLRDCIPTSRQMALGAAFALVVLCGYGPITYYLF